MMIQPKIIKMKAEPTYKGKKPIFLNPSEEAPFIKMNYAEQFDRILRKADLINVHNVFNYLKNESPTLEVYLSGGVIERLINSRHKDGKDYGDIDLLNVYDNVGEACEIMRFLANYDDHLSEIGLFKSDRESDTSYFNLNGIERVTLIPFTEFPRSLFKGLRKSNVDLGFISRETLDKALPHGQLFLSNLEKAYFNFYSNFLDHESPTFPNS